MIVSSLTVPLCYKILRIVSAGHLVKVNKLTTLQATADAMNERGIRSPRGGQWYPSSILNLIRRGGFQCIGALAASARRS